MPPKKAQPAAPISPAPVAPFELKADKVTGKNITFDRQTFDGFINFMSKLGLGAANQFSDSHWSFGPFLSRNRTELEAMYRSNWICGQVVDAIAEDMTRAGAEIQSSQTPDEIKALNKDINALKVWHHLCNTIKWSRLFGGAIAVLLVDGQNLETPLNVKTVGRDAFKGLLVLDRWLLWPSFSNLITDYGPEMGQPKYYQIIGDAAALPSARVHHTRIVRFDGIELPYYQKMYENGWGLSEPERMHDRLIAFDSVTQGAAQLVFKAHLRGVGVKGFREALSMGGNLYVVPMLGTGQGGFPVGRVAPLLVKRALAFFRENQKSPLREVYFLAYSEGDLEVLRNAIKEFSAIEPVEEEKPGN